MTKKHEHDGTAAAELPDLRLSRRRWRWRTVVGIAITASYLGGAILLTSQSTTSLSDLRPNEIGDFLAGILGPLTLLWVVLGYLQQGEELEHSTHALLQQAQELRLSVDQQRQLVEVTREQVESERQALTDERAEKTRAAQPIFDVKQVQAIVRNDRATMEIWATIANTGHTISSVRLYARQRSITVQNGVRNAWSGHEELVFEAIAPPETRVFVLEVSYLDGLLSRKRQRFTVTLLDPPVDQGNTALFNSQISEPSFVDANEPFFDQG